MDDLYNLLKSIKIQVGVAFIIIIGILTTSIYNSYFGIFSYDFLNYRYIATGISTTLIYVLPTFLFIPFIIFKNKGLRTGYKYLIMVASAFSAAISLNMIFVISPEVDNYFGEMIFVILYLGIIEGIDHFCSTNQRLPRLNRIIKNLYFFFHFIGFLIISYFMYLVYKDTSFNISNIHLNKAISSQLFCLYYPVILIMLYYSTIFKNEKYSTHLDLIKNEFQNPLYIFTVLLTFISTLNIYINSVYPYIPYIYGGGKLSEINIQLKNDTKNIYNNICANNPKTFLIEQNNNYVHALFYINNQSKIFSISRDEIRMIEHFN
ncbi:hypothetical protein KBD45_04765 [Candidatus Dojkabacteria bacterium]|nr:hypothetical protein [Candidatus Dojkabacteria bacterium]